MNSHKIEALLKRVDAKVIKEACGQRPHLPTVKHGQHRIFLATEESFCYQEAILIEKDLKDLALAAKFKGLKARLETVKEAILMAVS